MIILPAIDVQNGECVRLVKGDFATAHKVAEDALATAKSFEATGAKWIHMVDLDGAKSAQPVNHSVFRNVVQNTHLNVEVGGGIRDMETISFYLNSGVSRVILGSAALSDPDLVKSAVREYGGRIAVGIDARNGLVAAQGWLETSNVQYLELAKQMEQIGVEYLIFTDISRDGTLTGPNLEQLEALNRSVSCHVIASGGVAGSKDIADLKNLGLYGVICGKALYSGNLNLRDAIALAGGEQQDEQ
ncbi:MAG TPA: 1-(5-phosphoribosyl)-5-[(5-phosphoribosylamino)methylideneamino]imidazole-4-carboxamide isomerase [Clostridiales bacterium]|nr:1-(5-phosphoribosyl)-5-[(5-phosphoribosylamino)methylideneamino]imidazole-4-carboxamide isomerase [Clostridiales bacterium]